MVIKIMIPQCLRWSNMCQPKSTMAGDVPLPGPAMGQPLRLAANSSLQTPVKLHNSTSQTQVLPSYHFVQQKIENKVAFAVNNWHQSLGSFRSTKQQIKWNQEVNGLWNPGSCGCCLKSTGWCVFVVGSHRLWDGAGTNATSNNTWASVYH